MPGEQTSLSKFLAWVLRHQPAAIALMLSEDGWVSVDELLAALAANGRVATVAELET